MRRSHFCFFCPLKQPRLYQLHEYVILRLALKVKANVDLYSFLNCMKIGCMLPACGNPAEVLDESRSW